MDVSTPVNAEFKVRENVRIVGRNPDGTPLRMFQYNDAALAHHKATNEMPPQTSEWGEFKDGEVNYHNLIPTAGKAGIITRLGGISAPAAYTYLALGTGTNAAAAGDTTLQTEITTGGGARANSTVSAVTTTTTGDTLQIDHEFTFSSSFAITELGILNAASAGTLLSRLVFAAINVVNGTVIHFYWKGAVS